MARFHGYPTGNVPYTEEEEKLADEEEKAFADTLPLRKVRETRQVEYFSIPEQLDMQYWDAVNGTTKWQEHIAEIKAKHPKE